MKNAWEGLIIGALTGMVGGSAMDMVANARQKASQVFGKAVDRTRSPGKT